MTCPVRLDTASEGVPRPALRPSGSWLRGIDVCDRFKTHQLSPDDCKLLSILQNRSGRKGTHPCDGPALIRITPEVLNMAGPCDPIATMTAGDPGRSCNRSWGDLGQSAISTASPRRTR